MGHYGIDSKLQAQRRYEQRHCLRHFIGLHCRRGKLPQVGIIAVVGLRPQPAAQGDGDTAAVAAPGVAFVLRQAAAGAVDCAVGVDIEVVVVIDLPVAACRPVQVELRDTVFSLLRHNIDLCQ